MNSLYGPGYDSATEDALPKWAAKAIAKNQWIPAIDANAKNIPLSTFGSVDDRCIVKHQGRYYIKCAGDVAFFKRLAVEKGYSL